MGGDDTHMIADVLSRLDRKIDRLSAMGSTAAPFDDAPPTAPSIAGPAGSIDQALAEIEARQRMLDGGPATAPMDLPRAPTQRLPDLEQQLRQINARIETMRPCGIDSAVETLRDDLAEIGMMLKEAMPRQAIEALESEIRSLASRVDSERHAGADGAGDGGHRARPRRSPRRAARADAGRKPGRLRPDGAGPVAEDRPHRRRRPGSGGAQAA